MDHAEVSFWLSIASFATSSILAVIKAVEFRSARRVALTADARLTSSEEVGNTVVLLNRSGMPVTISYFELVWVEKRKFLGLSIPFTRKIVDEDSPADPSQGYDETIAPTPRIRFGLQKRGLDP
jgi:hypothetical protein